MNNTSFVTSSSRLLRYRIALSSTGISLQRASDTPLLFSYHAYHATGVSNSQHFIRNVSRHHTARAYDGTRAYANAGADDDASAYPYIVADLNHLTQLKPCPALCRAQQVRSSINLHARPEQNPGPNQDRRDIQN